MSTSCLGFTDLPGSGLYTGSIYPGSSSNISDNACSLFFVGYQSSGFSELEITFNSLGQNIFFTLPETAGSDDWTLIPILGGYIIVNYGTPTSYLAFQVSYPLSKISTNINSNPILYLYFKLISFQIKVQ